MKVSTLISVCSVAICVTAMPAFAAKPGDPVAGKKLYGDMCQSCHGEKGEGNPAAYKKVKAKIVHLGSDEAQNKSDDSIRKAMTAGVGKMDKVEDIENPQQVEDILCFIRTLRLNKK